MFISQNGDLFISRRSAKLSADISRGLRVFRYLFIMMFAVVGCSTPQAQVTVSPANRFSEVGIVDIKDLIPDVSLDIRYAGTNNFVGQRIDGYASSKCFLHKDVATALSRVDRELRKQDFRLKIFDCYRPIRAVKHFVRWAEDVNDVRTKSTFYPALPKTALLGEYIALVSGHSRAATLDLTLEKCEAGQCREVDMGTPFDFFDERAHTDFPAITSEQRANRNRLRDEMSRAGFENYAAEWWHYTFRPEPSPGVAYDIPVE